MVLNNENFFINGDLNKFKFKFYLNYILYINLFKFKLLKIFFYL